MRETGGSVPVPDPTELTTKQLLRELATVRELLEVKLDGFVRLLHESTVRIDARIEALNEARLTLANTLNERIEFRVQEAAHNNDLSRDILQTRLDGMDKAIELLQVSRDKFPQQIDEKIHSLASIHAEKFVTAESLMNEKLAGVQKQFDERDVRTEQAAGAVKIAVDAALQAQKEAASEASKSNAAATTKSEASTTKLIDAQAALITTMTKAFDDKIADVKDRVNRIEGGWGGATQVIGYVIAVIGILIGLSRFLK